MAQPLDGVCPENLFSTSLNGTDFMCCQFTPLQGYFAGPFDLSRRTSTNLDPSHAPVAHAPSAHAPSAHAPPPHAPPPHAPPPHASPPHASPPHAPGNKHSKDSKDSKGKS